MSYIKTHVSLTDSQKQHITHSISTGNSARLKLNMSKLHHGDSALLLTQSEYSKLQDGRTHNITIPHSRLQKAHFGGFLPFLLPLLGGLASLAGIAGGIAGAVKNSKEAQLADAQRAALNKGSGIRRRKIKRGGCSGNPMMF